MRHFSPSPNPSPSSTTRSSTSPHQFSSAVDDDVFTALGLHTLSHTHFYLHHQHHHTSTPTTTTINDAILSSQHYTILLHLSEYSGTDDWNCETSILIIRQSMVVYQRQHQRSEGKRRRRIRCCWCALVHSRLEYSSWLLDSNIIWIREPPYLV